MTMTMAYVPGVLEEAGTRLVGPSSLRDLVMLQRAQVTSLATAFDADGTTVVGYVADIPRFSGVARRLMIEGQRANTVRNPRAEGGLPFPSSSLPTNWAASVSTSSFGAVSRSNVGSGIENGIPYFDIRLSGTLTGGPVVHAIHFENTTAVAAAPGEVWTCSRFARIVGGSTAAVTGFGIRLTELTAAGALLLNADMMVSPVTAAPLGTQRHAVTRTLTGPTTGRLRPAHFLVLEAGELDITIRLGLPQLELEAFASSSILPAIGAPAASTRGADLASASLASLGITGSCTILWSGVLPQAAETAVQALFQLDDGSDNNGFGMFNDAAGSAIRLQRRLAAASSHATAGTMTPGTAFSVGMTVPGDGSARASFNGSPVVNVIAGPTSGLTTLRLGNGAAGTSPMFGEVQHLRVLPFAVTDTQLEAAVMALNYANGPSA
ncbi:MAG: hypothetical protein ACK4ZN_08425 [Oceanibaculum sp.]